jgi:lysophospholipase L1-like esterase
VALRLTPGQTVVFSGDSITDCGRGWGFGPSPTGPLGDGWVSQVVGLIGARYPEHGVTFYNRGFSGWTSEMLLDVWDDEVLALRPDVVTLMIGVNDLNFALEGSPRGVPLERYEAAFNTVVDKTLASGAEMLLLDSFYLHPDDADPEPPFDAHARVGSELSRYLAVVHDTVARTGVSHIRTHELFQRQMKKRPPADLCPEPVHPNATGHLVITEAVLAAWGW